MIKLINGPYNNREIEDSGTCGLKLCIYQTGKPVIGEKVGDAIYEISEDRSMAFWSHNNWTGTLEAIIKW